MATVHQQTPQSRSRVFQSVVASNVAATEQPIQNQIAG
jgi:hypothetical protein